MASEAPDRSKSCSNFLYKALLVTLILLLLPLFPSIAPEFVNQTLHARSWELIQLIFVGIAVSYGLFSNRIHETEKEHDGGTGNTQSQSRLTKLLQVSSFFEDESENPEEDGSDHKVETLHSKYYKQASEGGVEVTPKPLLLPVRSLKQGSMESDEDTVLPSPIPWRSRSGRIYSPSELVVGTEDSSVGKNMTHRELIEKVMMETSDEDSDGESIGEEDFVVSGEAKTDGDSVNDVGPDVDKKADEFIAKFREQIRQQRIESIRRSTAQRVGKSLR